VKAKLAELQIQLGHLSNVEERVHRRSCVTNASDCLHTEEFRCRNISPAALRHCTETARFREKLKLEILSIYDHISALN
jgi:hypothetical protein